ncbi:MAG TPA: mechanosensitive ion channel domain-containing protein [Dictyobacter sp.]|jgi:small-conductance mechanosensitive channel|nr:mechanosensitive ion channel domain-containing protein [Dictyobacter sp.]
MSVLVNNIGVFRSSIIIAATGLPNSLAIDATVNYILSGITIVGALIIGLLLRRVIVQRLKKTVLDSWLTQTIGVVAVIIPLLLGGIGALAIDNMNLVKYILNVTGFADDKGLTVQASTISSNLIWSVLLIAIGMGVARTIRALTIGSKWGHRIDINLRTFIGRMVYFFVLAIAALWILSVWHIPLTIPVTAISVITVAVSFAIQDILKDLVAGFYLLLERPFYIGDQVSITIFPTVTYTGKVQSVELRATKLRLISGEEVTIPNGTLFGNVVLNNTYYENRRIGIIIAIPQEQFKQKDTGNEIIQALKKIDTTVSRPEPMVLFRGYEDKKAHLLARFWVASGHVIDISEIMYALHTLLPDADLTVKEPADIV